MKDEFEDLFGSSALTQIEEETPETDAPDAEIEAEVEETAEEAETVEETVAPEAPATESEAKAEVPEPAKPEARSENFVPLAVLMEEREKAKAAKSENERLAQQLAELEAAKANRALPDPYDDPEGYSAFVQQQIAAQVAQQVQHQKVLDARTRAVGQHGEEFVQQLADWADEYAAKVDPNLSAKALSAPDPVQFVIDLRKRHEALSAIETEGLDAFVRRNALEMGLIPTVTEQVAVETPQPTAKKPVGPRSIANVSSRSSKENGSDEDFDAIFR